MKTPRQINKALRKKGKEIRKIRTRVIRRLRKRVPEARLADFEKRARRIERRLKAEKTGKLYHLRNCHEGAVDTLIDIFARSITRGTGPGAVTLVTDNPSKGDRTFILEPYGVFRVNNPTADHSVEILAKNSGEDNGWVYLRYNYNQRAPGGVVENANVGFIVIEEDLPRIKHLLKGRKENTLSFAMLAMMK